MALRFLDTNIIIRHVTKDNEQLSQKAARILRQVEAGAITVTTCEAVLAECVNVLSSKRLYHFTRQQIKTALDVVVALKGLKLPHKNTYKRALAIYASSSLDFADALAIAHMERQKITEIYSFDTDFDRPAGIKRLDR
jgi:predicted nucleic acid-binding protein